MEAPAINGNHVIEESEVEKPSEVEIETLALEKKPTNEISIETNGPTNEIPIETNGISEDPKVWQYWLSSFQGRDKKVHSQRKLLYFVNRRSAELSKCDGF